MVGALPPGHRIWLGKPWLAVPPVVLLVTVVLPADSCLTHCAYALHSAAGYGAAFAVECPPNPRWTCLALPQASTPLQFVHSIPSSWKSPFQTLNLVFFWYGVPYMQ